MGQVLDVTPEEVGPSPALSVTGSTRVSLTCVPSTDTSLGVNTEGSPSLLGYFCGSALSAAAGAPPWAPPGLFLSALWTGWLS